MHETPNPTIMEEKVSAHNRHLGGGGDNFDLVKSLNGEPVEQSGFYANPPIIRFTKRGIGIALTFGVATFLAVTSLTGNMFPN